MASFLIRIWIRKLSSQAPSELDDLGGLPGRWQDGACQLAAAQASVVGEEGAKSISMMVFQNTMYFS